MDRQIPLNKRKQIFRKSIIKYFSILLGLIIICIGIITLSRSRVSINSISISKVDIGKIEVSINASGRVVPLYEEIIISPINSRIKEVYKNIGDTLQKGDPILKLDLSLIENDYNKKLDEFAIRSSKLEQMKVIINNKISDLKLKSRVKKMHLNQLSTELKNEKYLNSIGASTEDKINQLEYNYEVAKLELEQLDENISNEIKNGTMELNVQKLDLSIFRKTLDESKKLLNDARILSPQKAVLTYINSQIGAQIQEGTQIAILSDLSEFKIDGEIADNYADRISIGSKVMIKSGNNQIDGLIVNITPSVKDGIMKFIVIPNRQHKNTLRSGLKVDVYVKQEIKENVLRIKNSRNYHGKGKYELWVVSGNTAIKRKVELGESNFEYIEVTNGLSKDENVIISDMEKYSTHKKLKIKN